MARQETELKPIRTPDSAVADVVFMHGLGGDWDKTWRHRKTGWSWPEWLADQNTDLAVWSLDYDIPPLGRGVRPLREHAKKALDRCRRLGERPMVMIGHSMGGLLAKAMVVHAQEDDSLHQLSQSIKGIVFLGTPHFGSVWATLFGWFESRALKDLRRNANHLHELHRDFLDAAAGKDLSMRNYKEERRVGPGKIVTNESADPDFEGVMCVGLAGNHKEIAKPRGSSSPVDVSVAQFIHELTVYARIRPHVEVDPRPIGDINPFVQLRETRNRHTTRFEAKDELPPHIPDAVVDTEIGSHLETERAVLHQGPSKTGKTHSAFTSIRGLTPHHTLISPTPGHLSSIWSVLGSASKAQVLWLDDLNRFAADHALTVDALRSFLRTGDRLIVATIRSTQSEALREDDTETTRETVKVLDWLPLVRLDGQVRDRGLAEELYPDVDFNHGIAGAFVALDRMLDKAANATNAQKGMLHVIADWQRLGFECIDSAVLSEFYPQYARALSRTVTADDAELDKCLEWATKDIVPDVALVMNRGVDERCLYMLDGVVDELGYKRPLTTQIVERGIETSRSASSVGYAALLSGDATAAKQAWRTGIELGDGNAASNLGILLKGEGDTKGAKQAWRTARLFASACRRGTSRPPLQAWPA